MLPACRLLQNEQLQRAASVYPFGASHVSSIAPQWQVAVIFTVLPYRLILGMLLRV